MGLSYTMHGVVMKVGSLVRWENADGEYELGIVTEMDVTSECKTMVPRVMVYFFNDAGESLMTKALLEVINENR